jgi:hypothetical protein
MLVLDLFLAADGLGWQARQGCSESKVPARPMTGSSGRLASEAQLFQHLEAVTLRPRPGGRGRAGCRLHCCVDKSSGEFSPATSGTERASLHKVADIRCGLQLAGYMGNPLQGSGNSKPFLPLLLAITAAEAAVEGIRTVRRSCPGSWKMAADRRHSPVPGNGPNNHAGEVRRPAAGIDICCARTFGACLFGRSQKVGSNMPMPAPDLFPCTTCLRSTTDRRLAKRT